LNQIIRISKQDIENKYLNKPILIKSDGEENWYILSDVNSHMPLHLLNSGESDLYDENEENIDGIELVGIGGESYLMWIYFETSEGWEAYGYEY